MEEAKAAAYYDELARKGGAAARFKQGLGFSSSSSDSTKPSDSKPSFYGSFVRASTPLGDVPDRPEPQNQRAQVDAIRSKLTKNSRKDSATDRATTDRDHHRRRSRSRERREWRDGGGQERWRSGSGCSDERRRRSSGDEDRERRHHHHHHRDGRRRRSRSASPRRERSGNGRDYSHRVGDAADGSRSKKAEVDYSHLIDGYSRMTPAEKVKAKMKLQLSRTAEKDMARATTTGWERFDFDKDAPLDDDDDNEVEVAEDDASLVKSMGKSFRFAAVEAKREDEIRAAHDQAMFGAPVGLPPPALSEEETSERSEEASERNDAKVVTINPFLSDKVVAMQQGSWRDRVRRQ